MWLKLSRNSKKKFRSRFDKNPNGCWIWNAGCSGDGYGAFQVRVNGKWKVHKAHRISWMIHRGPIPKGLSVLHDCPNGDNPKCVNPDHLWLGTPNDNSKDMIIKGRSVRGKGWFKNIMRKVARGACGNSNGTHTHPESVARGQYHGQAKLSDYDRDVTIPRLRKKGWKVRRIADKLGISRSRVAHILCEKGIKKS